MCILIPMSRNLPTESNKPFDKTGRLPKRLYLRHLSVKYPISLLYIPDFTLGVKTFCYMINKILSHYKDVEADCQFSIGKIGMRVKISSIARGVL